MTATRIVHCIPGRLRLRLPGPTDHRDAVAALDGQPGVLSWRWNQRTRSLLVLYDAQATSTEAVLDVMAPHLGDRGGDDGPQPGARPAGPPALALAVSQGMAELDASMARATGGLVDVRLLFPLGLFAWAAFELSRGAVGPLAWSSALWYAHGLFRDYNLPDSGA